MNESCRGDIRDVAAQVTASVRMGEIAVVSNDEIARALLGSCIAAVLFDSKNKVGSLAHIVLPNSRGHDGPPGKFVDTAIPKMIQLIADHGGQVNRLVAKLSGGSRMLETSSQVAIGEQNLAAIEKELSDRRIPILGRHCGGTRGRRVRFTPQSGRVIIEVIGYDAEEI
jgi:chemotaxis protein CheD